MKNEFTLPHMVLSREDVEEFVTTEGISDKFMQQIADRLSKVMMEEWNDSLKAVIDEMIFNKEG